MLSVFYASLGAEPQAARLAVSERSTPLPPRLSDTGLYLAGAVTMLRADHIAFAPQYPLWSDGTSKRRWIYPAGGAGQIPLTESDILGPSEAFRAPMDYYSHTPDTTAILERLAREQPTTLACMHGSAFRGDGAALLRALAQSLSGRCPLRAAA